MDQIAAWQQGHNAGMNLAIKLINDWCGFECRTIAEIIEAINQLKEMQ